jgi:hypothetical protein
MNRHAAIGSPHQRVIRTVVQAVIAGVPTVVAIIGVVADQWPAEWLVATAGIAVAIQGVLARIMAIPAVDAWLTRLGLGSAPRAVATPPIEPPTD